MDKKIINLLEEQKKLNYSFENVDVKSLIDILLPEIGNKNKYLRDSLIYQCLKRLFFGEYLSNEEMVYYTKKLISDDYLLYDLDNQEEYSSVKRTFSLLQIAVILNKNLNKRYLSDALIKEIFETVLGYYKKESILVAFDEKVGWIDSIPHTADVFEELSHYEIISDDDMKKIFYAVADKFKVTFPFTVTEDERTSIPLAIGIHRFEKIRNGIKDWVDYLIDFPKQAEVNKQIYICNNVKNLLRSLYFRLIEEDFPEVLEHLKNGVLEINRRMYLY